MALVYGSTNNLAANIETVVVTDTLAASTKLKGFIATGDAPARFVLRLGGLTGTILTSYRTSPSERTAYVVFPDIDLVAGDQICVTAINEEVAENHSYEATLIYV